MILVTGGAGFFGAGLVAAFNARGIEGILVVDILGKGQRWENPRNPGVGEYLEAEDFFATGFCSVF